jgi:hypothetical protein
MDITPPTIHLNGTGYERLLNDYQTAYNALQEAISAFKLIEFHSRDYYVKDSAAWPAALEHRTEQREALGNVSDYLLEHIMAIINQ